MVKRAAASHLGKYAASIKDKQLLKTEILEMCMSLAKDDQDSVRLLAVENFTQLGKMFTEDENRSVSFFFWGGT
jgi:serine/threonine-protein phosphatase 2A regulatory subunit A